MGLKDGRENMPLPEGKGHLFQSASRDADSPQMCRHPMPWQKHICVSSPIPKLSLFVFVIEKGKIREVLGGESFLPKSLLSADTGSPPHFLRRPMVESSGKGRGQEPLLRGGHIECSCQTCTPTRNPCSLGMLQGKVSGKLCLTLHCPLMQVRRRPAEKQE